MYISCISKFNWFQKGFVFQSVLITYHITFSERNLCTFFTKAFSRPSYLQLVWTDEKTCVHEIIDRHVGKVKKDQLKKKSPVHTWFQSTQRAGSCCCYTSNSRNALFCSIKTRLQCHLQDFNFLSYKAKCLVIGRVSCANKNRTVCPKDIEKKILFFRMQC